jgi:uncharacterized OB-fold protein
MTMSILPAPTQLSQPYWDGAHAGKLLFQECRGCGTRWHPPMPICPTCHSSQVDWREAAGRGSVYTYTIVYHPTHPAFQDQVPYVVAVVELDEGPRIVTSIKRCPVEAVHGGMRVSIFFEQVSDSISLPQAEPA